MNHLDEALGRLQSVLEPRVGKKMTRVVLQNMLRLVESGATRETILGAVHATLDAYARIPASGTPFPLEVAKAIGDFSALKLATLAWHQARGHFALGMLEDEFRAVGTHADALIPTYGDDDVEFAVRVAWKNAHLYRNNLVVGRALERNDARPVDWLADAWRAQGSPTNAANAAPIAVVRDQGVIYVNDGALFFCPHSGDPIALDRFEGVQRFFAKVPLDITPHTLSWIVHLVRAVFPGERVDVDGGLLVDWQPLEDEPREALGSALLGFTPPPPERREAITIRVGERVITYAKGELGSQTSRDG